MTSTHSLCGVFKSSYGKLNITESHANGWVQLILRGNKWQPMDGAALCGNPLPCLRAYLNARLVISLEDKSLPDDNHDLFADSEFAPTPPAPYQITAVDDIDIYEFGIDAVFGVKVEHVDQVGVMAAAQQALSDHLLRSAYTCVDSFEQIEIPKTPSVS